MTWRVLSVAPVAEKKVLTSLLERGLTGYYPVERVWRGQAGRRKPQDRPLIARYVFADLRDDQIPTAARLSGVINLLGNASGPYVMPEGFIAHLQMAEAAGEFDKTRSQKTKLTPGRRVKIARGQFQGLVGAIHALKGERRAKIIVAVGQGIWSGGGMEVDVEALEAA